MENVFRISRPHMYRHVNTPAADSVQNNAVLRPDQDIFMKHRILIQIG